jgi:hypothetical protein
MRFAFGLKNKVKIAFFLFGIMACSLLIRFLEDKNIKKINQSFISMYNDRLIPATDLYFIGENLFYKADIFQDFLLDEDDFNIKHALAKLLAFNQKIDSVVNKYERTYLVKQEELHLTDLKSAIVNQKRVENDILSIAEKDFDKSKVVYEVTGRKASLETLSRLSDLIKIQSKVGDELIKDSNIVVSGTNLYSTFQVFLAIAIGILIVAILTTSNIVKIQNDKFNLN